jgi:hypothetical protein
MDNFVRSGRIRSEEAGNTTPKASNTLAATHRTIEFDEIMVMALMCVLDERYSNFP